MMLRLGKWFTVLAVALLALPFPAGHARAAYSQAELDQMLAPIALYPDPLLSQILMAATFPEEVADAALWSADHRGVDGDAAVRMVEDFDWDPSVKSLVAFPTVLEQMGQSPDWTQRLGEAFLVQEPQVMDTVQALRQRAQAAGNLLSDDKVRILDEAQSIAIVPANPQAIYVPYYDPLVVYGTWWWPAYPPFAWHPWPGYAYRPYYRSTFWWGAPVAVSVGFFFGAIDWPRRYVRVVHADNYYVRRWVERRSYTGPTNGRWRPDYWQRRNYTREGTVTQSQIVVPQVRTQQFSAPTVQRPVSAPMRERQFSTTTLQPRGHVQPAPSTQPPRRHEEPGRFQSERRGNFERRADIRRPPESRRPEIRRAPPVAAPPLAAQQAAPARIERAPAPRTPPRAMPPAQRAQAAARDDRTPPAHAHPRERSR